MARWSERTSLVRRGSDGWVINEDVNGMDERN